MPPAGRQRVLGGGARRGWPWEQLLRPPLGTLLDSSFGRSKRPPAWLSGTGIQTLGALGSKPAFTAFLAGVVGDSSFLLASIVSST